MAFPLLERDGLAEVLAVGGGGGQGAVIGAWAERGLCFKSAPHERRPYD